MTRTFLRSLIASVCLVAVVTACATSQAADAAPSAQPNSSDGLLAAVPDDVGLCITADNLHAALAEFAAGPMFARWKEYPPLAKWHAEQREQLDKLSFQLKRHFGVSWDDLRSRLFGKQWVLGVYPPANGQGPPDGFLLVDAADAALLARAAEKLVDANRLSERHLGTTTAKVGATDFTIHQLKADGDRSVFLTYHEAFGVLATRRDILDRILKLRGGDRTGALVDNPEFAAGFGKPAADAVVRAFVRPRVWLPFDPESIVDGPDFGANEEQRRWLRAIGALRFASAGWSFGPTPRVELFVGWDPQRLPTPFDAVVRCFPEANSAPPPVPAAALAAVATNIDVRGITTAVMDALSRSYAERKKAVPAETLVASRLLGALGPGLRGYVIRAAQPNAAQSDDGAARLPVDWVVALDTQPPAEGLVPLAEAVEPLVRLALVVAADAYNAKTSHKARLETKEQDSLSITGLTNLGPQGIGSVYVARRGGRLLVGGTPESLTWGLEDRAPAVQRTATPLYAALHQRRIDHPAASVFVNLAGLRELLGDLSAAPPSWFGGIQENDQAKLHELRRLLSLVDGVLFETSIDSDGAGASLAIGMESRP